MNLDKWNILFENNKRLDKIFFSKYGNDDNLYKMNCIEILVELGEFVNETKVFKYWSTKKPNKEKILEEFADNLTMCMYFMSEYEIEIKEYNHIESRNILEVINYLYSKISMLFYKENEKEIIKDVFGNLLYLGNLLNLDDEEIIFAIENKHKIIEERLNSDY